MTTKRLNDNDVTDYEVYKSRRRFIQSSTAALAGISGYGLLSSQANAAQLEHSKPEQFKLEDELTPLSSISTYNNFYEFSLDKREPSVLAKGLKTRPWTIEVAGECEQPGTFDIDDLISNNLLEERIYRHRCVETWSMIVPWMGFELGKLISKVKPTSKAKYVAFETLFDPEQMPGQKSGLFGSSLPWPYREGLRIDEAMNPLTLLTVGLYGEVLPNQNGAPIRLIVPWKYGFKGIKSIVKISLVEELPYTTWNDTAPREYGFYANVNPEVDHPRWSQAREKRVGELFKRDTLMFNGYADQVASLYSSMDLRKNF